MDGIYIVKAVGYFGAALAIGIGCMAPAYGQGLIGSKACEKIGEYPESAKDIRMTMLLAMGIVESSAVYVLLISILLIFLSR